MMIDLKLIKTAMIQCSSAVIIMNWIVTYVSFLYFWHNDVYIGYIWESIKYLCLEMLRKQNLWESKVRKWNFEDWLRRQKIRWKSLSSKFRLEVHQNTFRLVSTQSHLPEAYDKIIVVLNWKFLSCHNFWWHRYDRQEILAGWLKIRHFILRKTADSSRTQSKLQ